MSIYMKAKAIILEPVNSSEVPNGAIFLDASNSNAATIKSVAGDAKTISEMGSAIFFKQMVAGGAFPAKTPISKRPDGKIIAADSDATDAQTVIGYSMEVASGDGVLINVLLIGANLVGAITGLGFAPGDDVFLSETSGYTNDPGSFTGDNDSIIKVGIADCAAGIASATAVDLVARMEVVLRP